MSRTYLCELGFEEIPARFMPEFLRELNDNTAKLLEAARLEYAGLKILGTYRRLSIIIEGLGNAQADLEETMVGPPVAIALDENGNPKPAAFGFAKRLGISVENLEQVEQKGQLYLAGTRFEKGRDSSEILPDLVGKIVKSLNLPIAMRWGQGEYSCFRPLHWIVSLLDDKVLPISLFGQVADRVSYGHRFLTQNPNKASSASGKQVQITNATQYETVLNAHFVMVDPEKRRELILAKLSEVIAPAHIDNDLLTEVIFLLEWPELLKGSFDSAYLNIPDEALIQCMKKHQKYFPLFKNDQLSGEFMLAGDSVTDLNRETIIKGNERVLKARLEDVKFFFDEDLKAPLENFLPKLEKVVFQKGLGSLGDKVRRLAQLGKQITTDLGFNEQVADIQRTITLAKADLVSQMVYELPELQGIMGGIYAQAHSENEAVSVGITEHYKPRFSGDSVPTTATGVVTSIADKLDTIVACFYNNLIPTGSQDPLGVRRALYGVASILFEKKLNVDIEAWITQSYALFGEPKNREKLNTFITARFENFLTDKGIRYDVAQAVLAAHPYNISLAYNYALQIEEFSKNNDAAFKALLETAVRVGRLAAKAGDAKLDPKQFVADSETVAHTHYLPLVSVSPTLENLATLTAPLTDYFDNILVMDKVEVIKNNRLAFLRNVSLLYRKIADFEKIVT